MLAIGLLELVVLNSTHSLGDVVAQYSPVEKSATDFEREILNARISFIYYATIQKPGSLDSGRVHFESARQNLTELRNQIRNQENSAELEPLVVSVVLCHGQI